MEAFKYVGVERYLEIYESTQKKCSSCGLTIPTESRIERAAITFFEVIPLPMNKVRFNASLNGHKILDRTIEEPCRYQLL